MKISTRAVVVSLLCASPVAFAGFTVIDDDSKRAATAETFPLAGDASVQALQAELERVRAELTETKARLADAEQRNERAHERLVEQGANVTPSMTLGFAFGSSKFTPVDRAQECALLGSALRAAHVDVFAFTDSVGTPRANERVATQRAKAAKSYLVASGVPAEKISAGGRQGDYIADNGTEAGRAANRRVEFHFRTADRRDAVATAVDPASDSL